MPTQLATNMTKEKKIDFSDRDSFVFVLDGALVMLLRSLETTNVSGAHFKK